MKINISKHMKMLVVCAMLLSTCINSSLTLSVQAKANTENVTQENLALHKTAIASSQEADSVKASNATDGDTKSRTSRWGSNVGAGPHWIYVDLGEAKEVKTVKLFWENRKATAYKIQVANTTSTPNEQDWKTVKDFKNRPVSVNETIIFDSVETARYIRLYISSFTEVDPDGLTDTWNTISIYEMEVYGNVAQNPTENVALKKTASESSKEDNNAKFAGSKAFDGNTTDKDNSRWSSAVSDGPHWVAVDLGQMRTIKTVRIYWETRKATSYKIETSDDGKTWTARKTFTTRPNDKKQDIVLDNAVNAKHVRLYIDKFDQKDPDSDIRWNTISIYEMEVYGGELKPEISIDSILNDIKVENPKKGDQKLNVALPKVDGYEVKYNGTDLEQVIDDKLNIHQPIVDKTVKVSFKVTKEATKQYKFKEVDVKIPGLYSVSENDNKAPNILPELQEWKGNTGVFTFEETSKVIYTEDSLKAAATALVNDYKAITGKTIVAVKGDASSAVNGDVVLSLTTDKTKGLMDEGYLLTVNSKVLVEAETAQGAYFATRTILQSIKTTDNIPCGVARDYPLYKVRGFILDVGRKTFTMDFLEDVVQEMAWYKMNDLQVHLNDNYIFLENYSNTGRDPMSAYSGFRLESDIKKGGNNGLNKADLTSKDVFYTKDEFRTFIKESRNYGVNIVPEFDTPAHSLALTKVRPDLRTGTNGRENDHLDLRNQYDKCIEFVQSIFNEYMGKDLANPVFDSETIIHIGADEYTADKEAYRKFTDEMLKFVQASGRTARVWGSLSSLTGKTPVIAKDVQMNLWNTGWANMDKMYEQGFDLINCDDGQYYVVPNAGYYYDYLNDNVLYNNAINKQNTTIPNGDKQMIGGAIAVWNDMIDEKDNGVSEYDVYDRIRNAIPLFGAKTWGKNQKDLNAAKETRNLLGDAPQTDFGYHFDSVDNEYLNLSMDELKDTSANKIEITSGKNSSVVDVDGRKALKLNGKESYINTSLKTIGLGNDLRVKVKRTSDSKDEQILFESPYGSIKAVQKGTGKVGFTRENHDYSFDYTLPVNEWVELEFKNVLNRTTLLVNGEVVDVLGDNDKAAGRPLLATMMLPLQTVGSKTNSFIGYVDDIRLGKDATYNSTMELDYEVLKANAVLNKENENLLKPLIHKANKVFIKFNPTKEEISNLVKELKSVLQKVECEKADYSRVDAYVALTKDLSKFTEETIKNVNKVIKGIRKDLPKQNQSTVNSYEKALREALDGLQIKKDVDRNYIDNAIIKATASSYQDEGSSPAKAFDNDPNTIWHSKWSITTMPHWLNMEFEQPQTINGITYLPRRTGANGNLKKYEILTSDDGTKFTKIAEGTIKDAESNKEKVITFDKVTTKHLRIKFVEAPNNNGSAAEIKVHLARVVPDLEGLNAAIKEEENIRNVGYTSETWNKFSKTIEEAKKLAADEKADVNAVEKIKIQLQADRVALRLNHKDVDKVAIEKAVKEAEEKLGKVTTSSAKDLIAAINNAKKYLEVGTSELSLRAVEELYKEMNSTKLVLRGNVAALKECIEKNTNRKKEEYNVSEEQWNEFINALENAKAIVADNSDQSQEKVDAAKARLEKIIAILDANKKGTDSSNSNGDQAGKPEISTPEIPNKPSDNQMESNTPSTGVFTNSTALLMVVLGAGVFVAFFAKRRKMHL